ncbi:transglutaminaseTgpA domain-containing protein [Bifidobacterium sp. ESL0763]|uniref:DUF3488 and transglutaminase-like domain-containing protein n=1 Tax=Bifidobacterium sp. ESL0763 TaxID=2983227 RepID=UPI0023F760DC|nr:transglutaminase domain-containing protein [Bifidobacterium sp. ESL0763]MDF7664289.1 transglutaminaseTgpA domain-containing protein [Bifidobacterium sp. ESL0763]
MRLHTPHIPLADITGTAGTSGTTGTATGRANGSWASETRSPIVLSDGRGYSFVTPHRSRRACLLGLAAILAIICLSSANLIDAYGSALMWAGVAIPAALLGCLIAFAGTFPALRLWWQLVFLVVAQFVVGPVITLNGTTIAHLVPTADTLTQGAIDTFGAFKYVISVAAPVGGADGGLMALWTLNLLTALLAGVLAADEAHDLSLASIVPLLLNLVVSALLGTSTGTARVACPIVAMIVLVVWLAWRRHSLNLNRLASATVIVVIAAALAFGACLVVPQHRLTLRERYNPPLDPHQYTSPMSDMRSYVKDHKKDTLVTARDLPAGTPIRLAVMDRFDGNVWNLSDSSDASDSSDYRKVGSAIQADDEGRGFKARITVHGGFSEQWLPLAGDATSITFADGQGKGAKSTKSDGQDSYYYNLGTHSAIVPEGTQAGETYTETGVIPEVPSAQEVARSSADHVSQPATKDVPDSVGKLAPSLVGKQSSDGRTADALATALKTKGWFSHGLTGDYPSLPGHGNYRIDQMLAGSAMVGDSEQYASTMALMARELGLPSRVVLGFLPKDKDGGISKARTKQTRNGTVTNFTGNDIEAWVEIKLKGHGWVAFYPTPKETKVPNKNQDLTPPKPKTLVRQPPVPLTDPLRDQNQARNRTSLNGDEVDDSLFGRVFAKVFHVIGVVAYYGSPLWIVLGICGIILLVKAVQLAMMRRRGSPGARIASGWKALDMLALQSGIRTHGTRREQSRQIAEALGADKTDELETLCHEADWAAFSGAQLGEDAPERYWQRIDESRSRILSGQTRWRRLRTRLSLRGVLGRPTIAGLVAGLKAAASALLRTAKSILAHTGKRATERKGRR